MKRLLTLLVAVMLVFGVTLCPIMALATVTTYSGTVEILPGNPRSSSPVYNYAWLDNLIVRDDAMSVTGKEIVPTPSDYKSSHTYDEFIKEAEQYSELFELNEHTVASAYEQVINAMYYVTTAMGMTDEMEPMRQYLIDYGIDLDPNEGFEDKAKTAVVYAAIKYDAVYTLYEKHITIPRGTTVDGATVIILSALIGAQTPGEVNTLTSFATYAMKTYVTMFEDLPISDDPDASEIFYWAKIITAAGNDHQVPVEVYSETTQAQKDYVDYAYYASILETIYDVHINPIKLIIATQSTEPLALQKLILQSMLDTQCVYYEADTSCEELFDLACENGYFVLENELYCDILTYDITVATTCEKIWFTPFALAGQVEDSKEEYVTMKLQGQDIVPGSTVAVVLDNTKSVETITLEVLYNSPTRTESATYQFTVYKTAEDTVSDTVSENNLLAEVEQYVNGLVPSNETADKIVDSIFSNVDEAISTTAKQEERDILTTYALNDTTYALTTESSTTTERFDFDYLEELIEGVYVTDENGNIVTTTAFSYDSITAYEDNENESNIVQKTIEAVQENPEIVAAPTGLVAVGALAGYFINKKHRDSDEFLDEEDSET